MRLQEETDGVLSDRVILLLCDLGVCDLDSFGVVFLENSLASKLGSHSVISTGGRSISSGVSSD